MRPLRVIHVVSALPMGGVEQNLLRVLPQLDRERFAVSVVCIRSLDELAPAMREAGVPVDLVKVASRYAPLSLWRLSGFFRKEAADIVHCHMRRANTTGRIAAILGQVPVRIATEHDMVVDKTWRHFLVDRMLAKRSDCILAVTRAVAEANRIKAGIPGDKFRVIYHGLDLNDFTDMPARSEARTRLDLPQDARIAGFVGRLHRIKNVDRIIRAMALAGLEDVVLAIVGDGEERPALERLTAQCGLTGRVRFLGFRDDLRMVYAALDTLVLASKSEGFGLVMIEALAAGIPLVSTVVGLAGEALEAENEYVRIKHPEPAELAAGIAAALEPERSRNLRRAGLKAARRFSLERQVEEIQALYTELAEQKGRRNEY